MSGLLSRPRRNRYNSSIRLCHSETSLTPKNFVLPLFLLDLEGNEKEEIKSMPNVFRLGLLSLYDIIKEALNSGITMFVLFPCTNDKDKTPLAEG